MDHMITKCIPVRVAFRKVLLWAILVQIGRHSRALNRDQITADSWNENVISSFESFRMIRNESSDHLQITCKNRSLNPPLITGWKAANFLN